MHALPRLVPAILAATVASAASSLEAISDEELIGRVAAREADAPAELFRRHGAAMFAVSCKIARDPALAEDALQDACLQAWRDAGRYDAARGSVLSWLLVITRGRTLDRLRSRQTRDDRIRPGFDVDSASATECPVDVALERQDRLGMVDAVMDVLPGADRRAVHLAYFEGLTHTEIADRLDLPLGTAKTQLRRAMQTIRTAVDDRPRRPFQWRPTTGPAAEALQDRTVLVVDDEPDTLKLTTLVLRRAGASVVTASSTLQAVDRLEALWPDVALIDLEMPELDGYALIARLRGMGAALGRRLPAIAFTAHGLDSDRHLTQSAGFDLHLAKPIRPGLLVSAVARLVPIS